MFLIMYVKSICMVCILHCFLLFLIAFNYSVVCKCAFVTLIKITYLLTCCFVCVVVCCGKQDVRYLTAGDYSC